MLRGTGRWLIVVLTLFLALTWLRAAHRPFWYDELLTLCVAGQPSLPDLWRATAADFNRNPPLDYLLTNAALRFGKPEVMARLPAMIGYVVMLGSLCLFVARRLPGPFFWPVFLLPLLSGVYRYAYEARAYGIVLGSAAVACLAWQIATEETARPWACRALTAALWIALLAHCYAALLYFPLVVAELWRLWERKRFDVGIAVALAVGALPALLYLPLLRGVGKIAFGGEVYTPTLRRLLATYWVHLSGALAPLAVLVVAACALAFLRRDDLGAAFSELLRRVPTREIVLVTAFALLPMVGFVSAVLTHGPFMSRYGLSATIGLSSLLSYLVFALARARPALVRGAGFAVLTWFTATFVIEARKWSDRIPYRDSPFASAIADLSRTSDRPVAVSNAQSFLVYEYYLAAHHGDHLIYLSDPSIALRRLGTNDNDSTMMSALPFLRLPGKIIAYRDFVSANRRFFVYDTGDHSTEWNLAQLVDDGAVAKPTSLPWLFDVTMP